MNKGGQANDLSGILKEENAINVTKKFKDTIFASFFNLLAPPGRHVGSLALGILVFWPGIEAATPVPAAQSLDHWTTREVPILPLNEMFKSQIQKIYYTQEKGLQEINSIWRLILWNQFKKKQWFSSFFHCHPYSKGKQILLSESDQTVRTKILSSWFFLEAT